jgi:hypothetical protein
VENEILNVLAEKLPLIKRWIEELIDKHANDAQKISAFKFARLGHYYSSETLSDARIVLVTKVPVPPLSALGLDMFSSFEEGHYSGITYKNTYFLELSHAQNESLHFHELVHVLQWKRLQIDKFLLGYAIGLADYGYARNPFEVMAYAHQKRFDNGEVYQAEDDILAEVHQFF